MSLTYCRAGYETGDYGSGATASTSALGITNINYEATRGFHVNRTLDTTLGAQHYTTSKISGSLSLAYRDAAAAYLFDSLFGAQNATMFTTNCMGVPLVVDVMDAKTPVRLCGVIITHIKIVVEPKKLITIEAAFIAQRVIATQIVQSAFSGEQPRSPYAANIEFRFAGAVQSNQFTTTSAIVEYNRGIDAGSYVIGSGNLMRVRGDSVPAISARFTFSPDEYKVFNSLLLTYTGIDNAWVYLTGSTTDNYAYLESVAVNVPKLMVDGTKVAKSVELSGFVNSGFIR